LGAGVPAIQLTNQAIGVWGESTRNHTYRKRGVSCTAGVPQNDKYQSPRAGGDYERANPVGTNRTSQIKYTVIRETTGGMAPLVMKAVNGQAGSGSDEGGSIGEKNQNLGR